MREAVEAFAKGFLRSRYGVAVVLVVIVLAVLAGAKMFGSGSDRRTPPGLATGTQAPITTVDPSTGDDGVDEAGTTPSPVVKAGTPEPVTVARAFAVAWLHHRGVTAKAWHDALIPHSTPILADKLAGVEPETVPADQMIGEPTQVPEADTLVEVAFPVDSGTLRLRLIAPDGKWLVDGVDWEPA
ncbi:hypothetical protein [Rhizomonospora bruguierae]|uniref:hypothetical protein n=1 Tax=Rhizomonospora bruguierae TaxID=1581705 RepID=UPI001BCE247D|nr:hypothetical protein [Micromonospora sp. NBRC 107566]